ncbi:MAG: hypothetical protein ABR549_08815 [Mycobacteriales bacterium]
MSARLAADLGLLMLLAVSGFAFRQLRQGGLDVISRAGLFVNLAGVSVLWLRTDKAMEGPILVVLGARHGVTTADLLVFVPAVLCLWLTDVVQVSLVSARLKRR